MNRQLPILLYLLVLPVWIQAQAVQFTTRNPRVEDANDREVTISRVELTERYTIIYMTFAKAGEQRESRPLQRLPLPGDLGRIIRTNTINFEPGAQLYANQGAQSFKFVRAENISTTQRREVQSGDVVDFVVYFERLDPGIEVFDLFECSDRNRPTSVCFNFWGVHVINPKPRQQTPLKRPATAAPQRPDISQTVPAAPRPVPTPDPPAVRPTPTTVVSPAATGLTIKGIVRDAKTTKPLGSLLVYQLLASAEQDGSMPTSDKVTSATSSEQTGQYQFAAQPLRVYIMTVSARGYLSRHDTLTTQRADLSRNFDLTPIEAGTKITLKNIYFDQSKYDLKPESYPELDRLVQVMRENRTMKIRLEGHTDVIGDFDANLDLSRNRVKAVRQYLATKGIDPNRVDAIGYGQSRPIKTGQGKAHPENRRVELVVTSV